METLKKTKLMIDMLAGHISSNFSEIQGSNGKLDQIEINFNKKLTLLENFSLEDILRLSFFLAERMEKEVPEERLKRAGVEEGRSFLYPASSKHLQTAVPPSFHHTRN